MNTFRLSLLLLTLQASLYLCAADTVTLSGPVSTNQLSTLTKLHPDMTVLDLSAATLEGNLIPAGAFAGTGLKSVIFPTTGAVNIGDGAFMGTQIIELVLPISIKSVGSGAFAACSELQNATLYGCRLDDYAFHLCPQLQWVELGLSTSVGAHAFDGCSSLRSFTTSEALTSIGDFAFANTGLIVVRLADCKNLTEVGKWAFANDSELTVITFPAHATLGEGVLFNCPALRDIRLPDKLREVPSYAFTGSTGSDGYYTVPDDVEAIGAFAYKDTDLGHIVLPPSLQSIGTGAMENAHLLSIIDAGNVNDVPGLGDDVWKGVDKDAVQLLVPADMTDDYKAALQWQDFRIGVSGVENPVSPEVGLRGAFDGDNLILEATGTEITRVEIFNEAGTCFLDRNTGASILSVPVGNMAVRLFLVRCTLSDGSVATLKLTR